MLDCFTISSQGSQMAVFEPNSLANHQLSVSSNGRFIAVASFTSDVKVGLWEVLRASCPVKLLWLHQDHDMLSLMCAGLV